MEPTSDDLGDRMSQLVDPTEIEAIVGAPRHPTLHLGKAVTSEQTLYVLHSQECLDSGIDLRECEYSIALDLGIDRVPGLSKDRPVPGWDKRSDVPVVLGIMSSLGGVLIARSIVKDTP